MKKSIQSYLEQILYLLNNPNPESLKMSLADVHHEGIFSLVIAGTEPGRLIRVFIADKKLKPFEVQFHTHRYPLNLTVLKGDINHPVALFDSMGGSDTCQVSMFEYRSPLNGGNGLKYATDINIFIHNRGVYMDSKSSGSSIVHFKRRS